MIYPSFNLGMCCCSHCRCYWLDWTTDSRNVFSHLPADQTTPDCSTAIERQTQMSFGAIFQEFSSPTNVTYLASSQEDSVVSEWGDWSDWINRNSDNNNNNSVRVFMAVSEQDKHHTRRRRWKVDGTERKRRWPSRAVVLTTAAASFRLLLLLQSLFASVNAIVATEKQKNARK